MRDHLLTAPLTLVDLVRVDPLARAETVHLADPARQVTQVVLAETFDRLRTTTAHSLVVLHAEAATGGWSLATALHVAWERHACGVVVTRTAMSPSSSLLAERLGIALFVIDTDPVDAALALAGHVRAPEAARALQVAQCAQRLAEQSSLRGVLGVLNSELAPVPVALLVGGSVLAGRAGARSEGPGHRQVTVEVDAPGSRPWARLVAAVPDSARGASSHVDAMLRLARLPLLAAWAQSRLNTADRAAQEAAAFQLLLRLAQDPQREDAGAADQAPGTTGTTGAIEVPAWSRELGWRVDGVNRAVRIVPRRQAGTMRGPTAGTWAGSGVGPSPELTQLVRTAWERHHPDWPIVAEGDGWISWRNSPTDDDAASVRRQLAPLAPLADTYGVVLGVGGAHPGVTGLLQSVTEARVAAHAALEADTWLEWFDHVGVRAALAWLPVAEITRVADLCLPDLIAARDRDALIETALVVLDCGGSPSAAASRLGVHRNTVLARLARGRALGLVLDDPAARLALHVVCYALRRRGGEGSTGRPVSAPASTETP